MQIRSIKITNKLKFKDIIKSLNYKPLHQSNYEVIYQLGISSYLIIYSFGVYSLFNVNHKETIGELAEKFNSQNSKEDFYNVEIKAKSPIRLDNNEAIIPKLDLKYIRIISLALAQSVMLDAFEDETDKMLESSIEFSKIFESQGKYIVSKKKLFKFIGFVLTTKQVILSDLHIYDLPGEIWGDRKLESMFLKLKDLFDIEQRYKGINAALTAIQENIAVITNWIQFKKSSTLEMWIILLFLVEIFLNIGFHFFN
jgi:uncharacterized Rmd1/YagE family protein